MAGPPMVDAIRGGLGYGGSVVKIRISKASTSQDRVVFSYPDGFHVQNT